MLTQEMIQQLQIRRAQLLAEREQFIYQANHRLGEFVGRLAEIEEQLKASPEPLEQNAVGQPAFNPQH